MNQDRIIRNRSRNRRSNVEISSALKNRSPAGNQLIFRCSVKTKSLGRGVTTDCRSNSKLVTIRLNKTTASQVRVTGIGMW